MDYEIIKINIDTYRIENNGVRFFLLIGTKQALLIDSGMTVRNAKEIAESITDLPVSLLNTHADIDHIGSNIQFDAPCMSPAELTNYHTKNFKGNITPVWDGDVINLGERELEIIEMPGHTPGSIAVLDKKYAVLFSGDPVQNGNIFMFGTHRNMNAYIHSLKRLQKISDKFNLIYPSHADCPLEKDIIGKLIETAENITDGKIDSHTADFMGQKIKVYDTTAAKFLCDAD